MVKQKIELETPWKFPATIKDIDVNLISCWKGGLRSSLLKSLQSESWTEGLNGSDMWRLFGRLPDYGPLGLLFFPAYFSLRRNEGKSRAKGKDRNKNMSIVSLKPGLVLFSFDRLGVTILVPQRRGFLSYSLHHCFVMLSA